MADFAAEAVKRGFSHYGFSPHSPVPIASPCNMKASDVEAYLGEVERLKKMYAEGPTRFYVSMEIDYLHGLWGPSEGYFRDLPLDYRIGSVHFIPSQSGEMIDIDGKFESFRRKMHENFRDDLRYVVNVFYDCSLEMLMRGGLDMIGHYDKIGHNGSLYHPGLEEEGWYMERVDELTRAIADSGVTVEINTKAWADHNRMFPAPRHWGALKEAGVPIVVNSDAHWPGLIDASRSTAFEMLGR